MTETVKAILVHGTFDTDATWIRKGSQYRADLQEKLSQKNCQVEFHEHEWDGHNTYVSRLAGARRLAETIIELRKSFLGKLYIICHSHGGNIARKALDFVPNESQPQAVITYGTPFIQFQNREVDLFVFIVRALVTVVAALISLIPLFLISELDQQLPQEEPGVYFSLLLMLVAILLVLAIWYLILFRLTNRIISWVKGKISRSRLRLKSEYSPYDVNPTPFVCFHVAGDEASILLRAWVGLTSLLNGALRFLEILILLPLSVLVLAILLEAVGWIDIKAVVHKLSELSWVAHNGFAIDVKQNHYIASYPNVVAIGFFALPYFFFLAYIVLTPLVLLVPWYIRRQFFGFGNEGVMGNFGSNIHIQRTPHSRSAFHLSFFVSDIFKGKLRHSAFMRARNVIEKTAYYMHQVNFDQLQPLYYSSNYVAHALFVIFAAALAALSWFEIVHEMTMIGVNMRNFT